MTAKEAPHRLVEHFFRPESGRLTAVLIRRFGMARLDSIEDSIQVAFESAMGPGTVRASRTSRAHG